MRTILLSLALVAMLAGAATRAAAQPSAVPLPAYNVDPAQVSVSGFGSGGAMAVQLGVAYSSRIMGVGAFATFPYDCLRPGGIAPNTCYGFARTAPDISVLQANIDRWSGHEIDHISNLRRQRIYAYVGAFDTAAAPVVFDKTVELYAKYAPAANIYYEHDIEAGHVFPTNFDDPTSAGTTCSGLGSDRAVSNCGFDAAGALLRWIYGPLEPRTQPRVDNTWPLAGDLFLVDQGTFVAEDRGMDKVAWLYVPRSCATGAACRLHVFLHDCGHSYFRRGDATYAKYSGLSQWAETNGIVVLFPQTLPDAALNPDGCWDESARYDSNYDQKGGTHITAIMKMVAQITSGFRGATAVEFRHAEFDHYFVTANADEIGKLDTGTFAGWARTGESFNVHPVDAAGTSNVCRFFSTAFDPKSSHFYTSDATECETVKDNPSWLFEDLVFAVALPDAAGNCAAATVPVYRLYNNGQGQAPNHRYTKSLATRAAMISQGWIPEGLGSLGMIGCVPG